MYACVMVLAVVATVTAQRSSTDIPRRANVMLKNFEQRNVYGIITFVQESDGIVYVQGKISGLPEGFHGIHVHDQGNISLGCDCTGPHFNPEEKQHGGPDDINRHVGDLGNIYANGQELSFINIVDNKISLNGTNSIVGRALVITENKDDLGRGDNPASRITGNSGQGIICGVIEIIN